MEIIKKSHHEYGVSYRHVFDYVDRENCGFSFDCDKDGNLIKVQYDVVVSAYLKCKTGVVDGKQVIDKGIQAREWHRFHPPIGRCQCGVELSLDRFTNTCECGRDYNTAGQELVPREQWGEETGETYTDIQDL
jgi:hypothetical protein